MNEYACRVTLPAADTAADFALSGAIKLSILAHGGKRLLSSQSAMEAHLRSLRDEQPPFALSSAVRFDNIVSRRAVGAAVCYTFTPRWISCKKHIVYFCGGAFLSDPTLRHLRFADSLAASARAELTLFCPPLTPTYTYADAYEAAAKLYASLAEAEGAENIILMGDSTGGSLALALCGFLARAGLPKPGGAVAFSPVCDLSLREPGLVLREAKDCALGISGLRAACQAWCGARRPSDALLSPRRMDAACLPKLLLFCGGDEMLLPDILAFAARAEASGVDVELRIYKNMFHSFQLYPLHASADALSRVLSWLG